MRSYGATERRLAFAAAACTVGLTYAYYDWQLAGIVFAMVFVCWRAVLQPPAVVGPPQTSGEPLAVSRSARDEESQAIIREFEQKILELRVREVEWMETLRISERASIAKDEFLSAISHELRTPLTSIRAYSEMLAEFCGDETPEVRDNFLHIIVEESERLTRLVDDLLDLAGMEAGIEQWNPQVVDLKEVVQRCFDGLGALAMEKNITFHLRSPAGPVCVDGEADRLQQALTNILANAWRFSPKKARIEVTIERGDYRSVVATRDHGPGIPSDKIDRVFERFVQVGSASSRKQGTGLGLAITRGIIERHRGTISCRNHPEGGAIFEFRLPSYSAELIAPVGPEQATAPDPASEPDS